MAIENEFIFEAVKALLSEIKEYINVKKCLQTYPYHWSIVFSMLGYFYFISAFKSSIFFIDVLDITKITLLQEINLTYVWNGYGAFLLIILIYTFYLIIKNPNNIKYIDETTVQYNIRNASKGAIILKIFAGDASFIDDDKNQSDQINNLRNNVKLLIRKPNNNDETVIKRFNELMQKGINVRAYSDDDDTQCIRGRLIKNNDSREKICLYIKNENSYNTLLYEHKDIYKVFETHFDSLYENGRHPLIKAVIFDLAGVAFSGKINIFYNQVNKIISSNLKATYDDHLCISDELNLGKIDIIKFLEKRINSPINEDNSRRIKVLWNKTWKKNENVFHLVPVQI